MEINIGTRIIDLRKASNMSQETLAEQIGVSRQAISKWERGEANPDIYKVMALAKIFNLSLDELIYGKNTGESVKNKTEVIGSKIKAKAEKLLLIGVAIILISVFTVNYFNMFIFGILLTMGVLTIIKSGFMFEQFYTYKKKVTDDSFHENAVSSKSEKRKTALATTVALICTAIYLYISLAYGLWHPGWAIFLLVPAAYVLYDVFEK